MAILYFPTDGQAMDWCPDGDYPGVSTVDTLKVKIPGKGVYRLKFGNEKAWFRSLTVKCKISFVDANGTAVDFKRIPQPEI